MTFPSSTPTRLRWRAAVLLAPVALFILLAWSAGEASAETSRTCSRFVVGEANSSAYPRRELPARGHALGVRCPALRSLARALHSGEVELPDRAFAPSPRYGRPSTVRHAGRRWACSVSNIGGSGPSYAVRCDRSGAGPRVSLAWKAG